MTTEKQIVEPGAMLRAATRNRDLGFHLTASWADVQRKAKRIRAEGGVTIVIASNDGVGGQVKGDHGTYEALLVYRPGTKQVIDYACGCKWAAYAFDRSPGFQRFEGRKCSHALALQFEAQSQGMFGKEVHPSEPTARDRPIVRYDPDASEHIFARPYEGSLIGSLVARLRGDDAEPAEVIGNLVRAGVEHRTAVLLWKQASHTLSWDEIGDRHPHVYGDSEIYGDAADGADGPGIGDAANYLAHERPGHQDAEDSSVHDLDFHEETVHPRHIDFKPSGVNDHRVRSAREGYQRHPGKMPPLVLVKRHNVYQVADGHHRAEAAHGLDMPVKAYVAHSPYPDEPFADGEKAPFHRAEPLPKPVAHENDLLVHMREEKVGMVHQAAEQETPGPKVSGIALKAHDTGRVLMLQRGLDDEKDPARGLWELPGGHHEEGDRTSLHAGIREFEEEVGQEFPLHGVVKHTWTSPNGVYQGHVVVIPSEKDLSMKDGRVVPNPDDPKGDCHEQAAWWEIEHAKKNPALRPEVKAHTPWKEIEKASLDAAKTASYTTHMSSVNEDPQVTFERENENGLHALHAHDHGGWAASLSWNPESGTIDNVEVRRDLRRRGLATKLWNQAREITPHLRHDDPDEMTEDGHAWARAVGGSGAPGRQHLGSAWDPISNTNPQPGRGTSEPAHSNTTNPASTGWAAGEDPDDWNNLDANPEPLTPSLGFDAVLHAQPEPALPVAYGDEDATMRPAEMTRADLDPVPDNPPPAAELVPDSDANIHLLNGGSALPNSYHASTEGDRMAEIVASFQKSAAGKALIAQEESADDDIAAAARMHLAKEGAKQFDFAEQQELISEGNDGRRARNLGALKIEGTHYELLDAALRGEATDSTDLFI